MKFLKTILSKKNILVVISIVLFFVMWSNLWVHYESKNYVSTDLSRLPDTRVGLLLGTSKLGRGGKPNPYFYNRIDAACELFNAGKIECILISGDNGTKGYNEPEDMKQELLARGVPEGKIFLDYAGFDTYDSVLRANKIFGQNKFIVISQEFHNKRAVYIARRFGLEAYGYNAKDFKRGYLTQTREYFARVKAYFEVKFSIEPTYLGEKIEIR